MKKLAIILAIVIMLFALKEQQAEQPETVVAGESQSTALEQTEKVPEMNTEQAEKTIESICEPVLIENEVASKEETAVQTPMKECAVETEWKKDSEPEETVECVSRGDQTLAEYKPQPSGQVNPFENAPPAEIVDHPVEALIGQGEDRPGEGKHF